MLQTFVPPIRPLSGLSTWRRAVGYARPYRGPIAAILALTVGNGLAGALDPVLFGSFVDGVAKGDGRSVAASIACIGAAAGLREVVGGATNWLTWRTRVSMNQDLQQATVTRLQRLPMSFHRQQSVGELMSRIDRGIQGFVSALTELAFNLLPAVVYLLVSAVIMFRLDWRLAVVVLLFVPGPALIAALAAPEQLQRERELMDRWTRLYGRLNEVLAGILTVKSFAMEDAERSRFLGGVSEANARVVRGVARDSWVGAARNLVVIGARTMALALGGWMALQGQITAGAVVTFVGYAGGLFTPVQGLVTAWQTVRKAAVSLDAVYAILDADEDPADLPDARSLPSLEGRLDLEHVAFHYEPGRSVLADVDLHVRPGECVALVGPSGSGKSTIIGLVQRLYDPSSGAVRLDGHDLRTLDQRWLRRNIGVVLQDGVLFDDTVAANIAYGRPSASRAEIEAAARAANAHEFVTALPDGYDSRVGERGGRLSAGQRQRVAIARALLKDPPVLILDEATSALDAESEALVQQALDRLLANRTSIVVAHRLSTVVRADRILALREGRIVEQGTHAELVARRGYYASLVDRQVLPLLRTA